MSFLYQQFASQGGLAFIFLEHAIIKTSSCCASTQVPRWLQVSICWEGQHMFSEGGAGSGAACRWLLVGSPPQDPPAGSGRGCTARQRSQGRGAWSTWNADWRVLLHPLGVSPACPCLIKACFSNNRCTKDLLGRTTDREPQPKRLRPGVRQCCPQISRMDRGKSDEGG